jgi:hypothetical protein
VTWQFQGASPRQEASEIGRDVGWGCVPAWPGSDVGRRLAVAFEVIRRLGGNTFALTCWWECLSPDPPVRLELYVGRNAGIPSWC